MPKFLQSQSASWIKSALTNEKEDYLLNIIKDIFFAAQFENRTISSNN